MRIALMAAAAALSVAACSTAPEKPPVAAVPEIPTTSTASEAVANLASASGSLVSGRVKLVPMGKGVHITGVVGGLPAGSSHGFHVHEKGDCSAADASSAGAHFNPFNTAHGKAESGVHHAGDMDNIVADAEGVARIDVHVAGVTLGGGAVNDIASRALIVHAAADDYRSQPAGNAGARVACGLITVTR
ncbi:superoxide dismutase family protein [Pseudoxanthomonas wuyuanensis]|uniref:Superoxide dismutase [Cu-Zn] n=1 Tax=Pseudoxanthomonas wuyuanensis TaxID=1073196 RepID=A0A286D9R9_9GAMM|nr:superoxide dismutase family protein [Pseudoxanthomonas wuyuanensis]SOD55388.1 superoxide dismutase, Cu-Zn family [Pseudoxanthomonas wuyuanensis]